MKLTLALFALAYAGPAQTGPVSKLDHSPWGRFLAQYESREARIDYGALKSHGSPDLREYLRQLAGPWPKSLTLNERKAALIDAYNALTVNWIVRNYPVPSIWRTSHPFTEARHEVDGRKVSLDQIETELRNMGDPRIHAALVCASISCPALRREAYVPEQLERQLDDSVRSWLGNAELNRFDPANRKAEVSMIFDWYKSDFEKSGSSVLLFLSRFAPVAAEPGLKLTYRNYNWGLNDTSNIGANYSKASFYKDYLRNKL